MSRLLGQPGYFFLAEISSQSYLLLSDLKMSDFALQGGAKISSLKVSQVERFLENITIFLYYS